MTVNIHSKNMELTAALKEHAQKKADSLMKYYDGIESIDVDFGMESMHHNKGKVYFAEMKLVIPGKNLFVKKEAEDMYKAIDKVKDHLKIELEKIKGKMRKKDKKELRGNKEYQM